MSTDNQSVTFPKMWCESKGLIKCTGEVHSMHVTPGIILRVENRDTSSVLLKILHKRSGKNLSLGSHTYQKREAPVPILQEREWVYTHKSLISEGHHCPSLWFLTPWLSSSAGSDQRYSQGVPRKLVPTHSYGLLK